MIKPLPFGGCFTKSDATKTPWVFLGIADDTQSTYLHGPAEAPEAMRQAYDGNCFNATTESGVDLAERLAPRKSLIAMISVWYGASFSTPA